MRCQLGKDLGEESCEQRNSTYKGPEMGARDLACYGWQEGQCGWAEGARGREKWAWRGQVMQGLVRMGEVGDSC